MLRTVVLLAGLATIRFCLPAIAMAQNSAAQEVGGRAPVTAEGHPLTTTPAIFKLAQNGPTNLAERLKAIRGDVTHDYGTSSRRTANRATDSPAAAAPITPTTQDSADHQAAPATDLPSVLVRRGGPTPPAPITDAGDLTTTRQEEGLGDAFGEPGDQADSSRRTARRWRSQTPTYETPAPLQGSTVSRGASLGLSQPGPVLRVETDGPKAIAVGKEASYRISLLNQGTVAARQAVVTASLPNTVQVVSAQSRLGTVEQQTDPAGGRRVVWSLEQVTASSQQELVITLKATENRPLDMQIDWMYRPASLSARIDVQQPQVAVSIDGPVEMKYGETKVFKVKLSNPGNGPAENVAVNIAATGANSQPNTIGTLAAGESRTLELELTANQAGKMQVRAVVRGDGDLQAQSDHDVHVRRAQLVLKINAPELLYAGTTASYQILVANQGDAAAEGVIMQIDLPQGAKNGIGVDKKPITMDQPRWRIGELGPGSERVYSLQCDLTVSGQNQLTAQVQGTDNTLASDNVLTMVEAIADLKLLVNDPKGPIQTGKDVIYEIQILNRGSKEATNVSLVAQFSEGIEPSAATGHRSEIVPGQVVFEPIETIAAGGQLTVKITARAIQGGNLRFRAELTCGDPETKLVAEESTRFYGAATRQSGTESASRSVDQPTPARR